MKTTVIVDIDGTISRVGDRLKYLHEEPKNWDAFYDACFEDEPILEMVDLVKLLSNEYRIVFCTGRRESTRNHTFEWLESYGLSGELLMRPNDDFRHDTIVKPEVLRKSGIFNGQIAFVLEDRTAMVNYWRGEGVRCLQVAPGDF